MKNYTHAYTTFTVRSVLNPDLPNNHGSLAPIKVEAPVGSIVNAVSPQPCTARHVVGMFLPNALLKALAQIRPDQAMAEGSGAVWTMQVSGNHDDGRPFITAMFTYAGGVGARAAKPGLSACSYPTGVAAVPIEVVEASAPDPLPAQGAPRRQRRRGRAGRRPRPDDRVHRRHRAGVAAERRHLPSRRRPRGHLRWRAGRRRRVHGQRRARRAPRPVSPCSRATTCASTCPVAAATAHPSPWRPPVHRTTRVRSPRHDDPHRRAAHVVRREHHRLRHRGHDAAGDLHLRGVPRVRARGPVRLAVAVRRRGEPHPRAGRLLHDHHRQRRADHRRPGQGRRGARLLVDLPAPRHADRRRRGPLHQVHLPVPPVELRPHRPPPRCAGHGAHGRVRQEGLPAAGAEGRAVAGLRVRELRPRRRAARPHARDLRRRTSSTTTSSTPCAPARSPSPTSRGTGR